MRFGAACRKFSNLSGTESLANEAAVLEEVSLSAFSLMKSIKSELETAAKNRHENIPIIESSQDACGKQASQIIMPYDYKKDYFVLDDEGGGS